MRDQKISSEGVRLGLAARSAPEEEIFSLRGYRKIAGAARAFNFNFKNKVVLDIGSSTGGFTKYALDHGAKKVIAVEKGTNQMMSPLRHDPRIDLREKTDIFDCKIEGIDVVVADVSFISLTKVLAHAKKRLAGKNTDFLVMLKPQFEAKSYQLVNGIIKNEKIRREIIKSFEMWLKNNNFVIIDKRDNQLKGKNGNQERFYWLKQPIK
ncbi:TlyA family rRNA (cytidine-2'-O)-methyltransferase [Candidatus Saccharibacteria bacterium]|nr:TlyA family rRNA (cytidine-2'-O)-methyltransferase [Candidatus Saccharibacteria bacterium]